MPFPPHTAWVHLRLFSSFTLPTDKCLFAEEAVLKHSHTLHSTHTHTHTHTPTYNTAHTICYHPTGYLSRASALKKWTQERLVFFLLHTYIVYSIQLPWRTKDSKIIRRVSICRCFDLEYMHNCNWLAVVSNVHVLLKVKDMSAVYITRHKISSHYINDSSSMFFSFQTKPELHDILKSFF